MSSRMNLVKIASLSLVALGVGSFLLAIVFLNEDFGSCPLVRSGTIGFCDHTFPGTTVYIGPVVTVLAVLGTLALGFGVGILLLSSRRGHTTQPTPSQAG